MLLMERLSYRKVSERWVTLERNRMCLLRNRNLGAILHPWQLFVDVPFLVDDTTLTWMRTWMDLFTLFLRMVYMYMVKSSGTTWLCMAIFDAW